MISRKIAWLENKKKFITENDGFLYKFLFI